MSENEDVQTVLVHSEEVPDLKGVSVSSQGQIAFHFDHYIETYSTKYIYLLVVMVSSFADSVIQVSRKSVKDRDTGASQICLVYSGW